MPESKLIELAQKLDDGEKATLTADLPDLFRDAPRTQSAATSFKRLAAELGGRDRVGLSAHPSSMSEATPRGRSF
jgi:hypothetical protein